MTRFLVHAAAALAIFLSPVASAAEFDDAQRAEIGEIVRDYLLENPEVLAEVSELLRTRRLEAEASAQRDAVTQLSDLIFDSPRQVVIGNPDGDVTLVEFFDYNCTYCRASMPDIMQLIEEDDGLRVVLKEMVALGQPSYEAARVAVALQLTAPEIYPAFHETMLSDSGTLDEARSIEVAESLGVDGSALRANLDDPEVQATLEEVLGLADALGVTGTPSFILGEEVIVGARDIDELRTRIASVRACGSTTC
jgi:protein-disulfide isomerase